MLTVCPTPIGNLEDLTLRVIRCLREADLVACEDTRTTIKLLNHLDIKVKMLSYHEHNEASATQNILERLKAGERVALVSDAGMPGISDPGEVLIKACIEADIPYTVLPGPSAAITALVASQVKTQPFYFEGFVDRTKRKKRLAELANLECTLIFYESPHRLLKTLSDMISIFGDRRVTLGREISKRYETYWHTSLKEAVEKLTSGEVATRGEYVIVLEGKAQEHESHEVQDIDAALLQQLQSGVRLKDAVKGLAKSSGIDRQALYKRGLSLQETLGEDV